MNELLTLIFGKVRFLSSQEDTWISTRVLCFESIENKTTCIPLESHFNP